MRVIAAILLAAAAAGAFAAPSAEIKFYQMDADGREDALLFVFGAGNEGCQTFSVKRAVHRVAVLYFAYCELYSVQACTAGNEVAARWKNKRDPVTQLTPGAQWVLKDKGNATVGAWRCSR